MGDTTSHNSNRKDNRERDAWLAGGAHGENIYSIPPSLPFLKIFAQSLVSGDLIDGFSPKDDPFCLADATIYLPTRRAARGLSLELLEAMNSCHGNSVALMPRIYTIGDLDEDEMVLGLESDIPLDAHNKINSDERRIILARLVRAWSTALKPKDRDLFEEEDIILPSSAADAIRLAASVANFMDRVETEEIDWRKIKELEPDTQAAWWQITIAFLQIVMEKWPAVLSEKNKINPAAFRSRLMNARIEQLASRATKGPIIVAGSTGSIPATTRLIKAVSKLKNGAVILPGVDHDLPPNIAIELAEKEELAQDSVLSTHPQFGLGRLAGKLNIALGDIERLGNPEDDLSNRERIINIALLPPKDSADWLKYRNGFSDEDISLAINDITLIQAAGDRQEALAIALVMRETLVSKNKTASLITPDRNLAQRVANELKRFNINVDDSGGTPLLLTTPAMFLRQAVKCMFNDANPINYASLLKNEHFLVGFSKGTARKLSELLELLLIRDAGVLPSLGSFEPSATKRLAALKDIPYAPKDIKNLTPEQSANLLDFAGALDKAFAPLIALKQNQASLNLHTVLLTAKQTCQQLSMNKDGQSEYFKSSAGQILEHFLDEHIALDTSDFHINPFDVAPVLEALLSDKRITDSSNSHPRLHIYGPLEARLQTSDVVILSGLNEGTWPQLGSSDPFLNRPMSSELGLPLPERRIGLSAHDFQQLSGNRKLYYTRSERVDGTPSIASRWLQRLMTFIGETHSDALKHRGDKILEWARLIDLPTGEFVPLQAPQPTPPVSARPTSLSITEIETWIRDPYAIYAKHVLNLHALPELIRDTDAAMKGNLYHKIVERFVEEWQGEITEFAFTKICAIADEEFDLMQLPAEIKSVWRPRFEPIAKDFINWEKQRHHEIKHSHLEIKAKAEVEKTGFVLRGRADRIDVLKEGSISVIDYKTGTSPSKDQAKTLSPQLALEGALAIKGHFEGVSSTTINELLYIRLRENNFKIDDISTGRGAENTKPADEIIVDAWENLVTLIEAYKNPVQGYVSRYAPAFEKQSFSKYDHLARFREWSIAGDDDGAIEEEAS
ncbi:MAG: double-strand break repair protein AddB [Rhizobiales bacterium]|nr:double-strand break repair protein AddB [Hyphomicrobiales bacterium]